MKDAKSQPSPAVPPAAALPDEHVSPLLRVVAQFVLTGLLLVLALRLTMTETFYEAFTQQSAAFIAKLHPNPDVPILKDIGPTTTFALSAITLFLVAAAAWCASIAHALTFGRIGRFLLILAILGFGLYSTLNAANRFQALIGLSDVALSLLAGWGVSLLCSSRMLGISGRRTVVALLLAMLAVWTARGLYQRFIDIPDTIDYYNKHKVEALASQGMEPGDPGVALYESRMLSKEVTGYVTLSNVMGAGMIALLAVAAGCLAATFISPFAEEEPEPEAEKPRRPGEVQIPLTTLIVWLLAILLVAGTAVLFMTESRGASVLGVAAMIAILLGARKWPRLAPYRRTLIATTFVLLLAGAAAVVAFGITHDRLPTKSLMFRWHYWTASVPLIKEHPLTGVGFNNFGDYYGSVKRASSPEDVRDPHSFFIRFAAEAGLPVAILVGLLLLWQFLAGLRQTPESAEVPKPTADEQLRAFLYAAAFCSAWWVLHQLVGEQPDSYAVILSCLSAALAIAGWMLAFAFLTRISPRGLRCILIAGLLGALGMLVYDQINMALVAGPVATLFWILLGLADSCDVTAPSNSTEKTPALPQVFGSVAGILTLGGALAVAVTAWWPTFNGAMPWDPRPFIDRYLLAFTQSPPDWREARDSLQQALDRDPRNVALHQQMMLLDQQLHEPTDEQVQRILELDPVNARIHKSLALENNTLPPQERLHLLQQALELNDQLPPKDVMRLSPKELQQIQTAIAELRPATLPPAQTRP